jgi:hypothetical protein
MFGRRTKKKKIPFELDVKQVLGRKAHNQILESRGMLWDDKSDAQC